MALDKNHLSLIRERFIKRSLFTFILSAVIVFGFVYLVSFFNPLLVDVGSAFSTSSSSALNSDPIDALIYLGAYLLVSVGVSLLFDLDNMFARQKLLAYLLLPITFIISLVIVLNPLNGLLSNPSPYWNQQAFSLLAIFIGGAFFTYMSTLPLKKA